MNSKLALLLPIRCILFILSFLLLTLILNESLENLTYTWSIVCTVINIIVILIIMLLTKLKGSNLLRQINYEKGKTKFKEVIIEKYFFHNTGLAETLKISFSSENGVLFSLSNILF